jgi:ABC-2 type transport system ATP-binding protein
VYPQRTVLENATFFAELKGLSGDEAETQLGRVGLRGALDLKARQLSKGMLQRLGLAIALCGQPRVLVLDEPFNGLDPALLGTVQEILRDEQAGGATLLVSTHTMSAIEPLATDVAVLIAGKLVVAGRLDELRDDYAGAGSLEKLYHRIATSSPRLEEVAA